MRLINGVKVVFPKSKINGSSRLKLSKGTIKIEDVKIPNVTYFKNSIVPKLPWSNLSESQIRILTSITDDTEIDEGSFVALIKIPDEITAAFENVRDAIRQKRSRAEVNYLITNDKNCIKGKELVKEYVKKYGNHLDNVFIGTNPPNLLSVTYDPNDKEEKLIGLHVDNWYRNELKKRHLSPRRICINLGVEDRFLQFINLPLKKLFQTLEDVKSNDERRFSASSQLGQAFMERFPNYPVVRLRVAPTEAYIASTDNIIHDGSTQGNSNLDMGLHIHGYFFPY